MLVVTRAPASRQMRAAARSSGPPGCEEPQTAGKLRGGRQESPKRDGTGTSGQTKGVEAAGGGAGELGRWVMGMCCWNCMGSW